MGIEINDESKGTCNTNNQIRFKTSMVRKSLCEYSDADIRDKGTITVTNIVAARADGNNTTKKVIFKNCASFTSSIKRINNAQIDDAQHIDGVVPMYNLIEYSDYYSKASGISLKYCRDVPAVDNNGAVTDFTDANVTDLFNLKDRKLRCSGY